MSRPEIPPQLFVIFGGTGDLAARKLLPALERLSERGLLGDEYAVLAVARDPDKDDESVRRWAREALEELGASRGEASSWCTARLHYQPLGDGTPDDYAALAARIEQLEGELGLPGNRVFYMALPPGAFPGTISGLGEAGLNRSPGWTRLVIEKPFGRDLESAHELNELSHRYFTEEQLYRIDHYLGKETVQNLIVFRFANSVFESLWNRDRIENIQITVAESLGVEQRAGYYERAGAVRDMIQNHVTQLVSLIGMEAPVVFDAETVRHEKIKVLRSLDEIRPEDVVFGQYGKGAVEGRDVPGYLEEPGVAEGSQTETYVALRLRLSSWRWQGVPFYIRTGKRLSRRLTQIAVVFREAPVCLFESLGACDPDPNVLLLTLQPNEGFVLCFSVKEPGGQMSLRTLPLHFHYGEAFGKIPEAYETLLLDVLRGDQTLFVHAEEAEASWRLYEPLIEGDLPVEEYPAGSWGPAGSDRLLAELGHEWHPPIDVES